ncbi:MAG: hypothetical protein F4X54_07170 [Chloroflexi bacterium]|nr:hypothetical protein [Chloroflexota bacterium]
MPYSYDNPDFDALVRIIESLEERIRSESDTFGPSEALTRMALVDPLLNALGLDLIRTRTAFVAPLMTTAGWNEGTTPVVFTVVRRLSESLENHRAEALAHANMAGISYAGLTNGDRWELYEVFKEAPLNERRIVDVSIRHEPAFDCAVKLLLKWRSLETGETLSKQDTTKLLVQALEADAAHSVIMLLLDNGAFSEHQGSKRVPLHTALMHNAASSVIETLLDHGADVTARDDTGRTALHLGVEAALREMTSEDDYRDETSLHAVADLLVSRGADISARTNNGRTAAHLVAEKLRATSDSTSEYELKRAFNLLQHGRLFSQRFWFSNPSVEQVRAEVNRGVAVTARDNYGMTPLHYAVQQYHNTRQIEYLLDNGADIMARDSWRGDTPLHCVMYPFHRWSDPDYIPDPQYWHWKVGTVNLLLAFGADVTATNNYGDTPLHDAITFGSGKIGRVFSLLLNPWDAWTKLLDDRGGIRREFPAVTSRGADLTAQNHRGETPLHLAVEQDLGNTFLEVLVNPTVVNMADKDGETPLHWAACWAKKRQLGGVDPVWAADRGLQRTSIELLLDSGAEVDTRNNKGRTPLHVAAASDHYFTSAAENIKSLLNRSADATATDNDGRTPYQLAEEQGASEEILRLLRVT